jgi:iron complex outermembrane receptor protein
MKKTMRTLFCSFTLAVVLSFWMPGIVGAEEAADQSQTGNTKSTAENGQAKVPVTEVEVQADRDKAPKEGSAEAGYKPDTTTTTGPWGKMKLQDTPYSISVMSSDLIENVQANSTDQLIKMNPLTYQRSLATANDMVSFNMRGFGVSSTMLDGIRSYESYGISMEEVDRVEFFSGLSGFLYGGGGVGGSANFVLKRPTATPLADITVGNYGGSNYYIHGDFGGPLGKDGKFGYRLNVLTQNGDTAVDGQSLKKNLISGAIDWHATDKLLFQFEAAHREYYRDGNPIFWYFDTGVMHPAAPDASKLWSQKWTYNDVTSNRAGASMKWDISDSFNIRAGYRYQQDERSMIAADNILHADGTYTQELNLWAPNIYTNQGGYLFFDTKFKTGSIEHKLTTGYSYVTENCQMHPDNSAWYTVPFDLSFSNPYISASSVTWPARGTLPLYSPIQSSFKNVMIGDNVKFNEKWSAMLGLNRTTIYDYSGYQGWDSSTYNKTATTPTVSFIYKPESWLSTYATYMESLEEGTIVGDGYTNAGAILPPMVSKQYEVGAKATVGGTLLTAALFQIDKANQYSNKATPLPTYVQDGRDIHKGIELTISGKVNDKLTLLGGVTLMDCYVNQTNNPSLVGKRPTDIANQMAKIYAEYSVPSIKRLTLTGGIYWIGNQYSDTMNTELLPTYAIGDIGLRYETRVNGTPVTYRLNVTNVTNKNYWLNSYQVGEPRTVSLSAQMKF